MKIAFFDTKLYDKQSFEKYENQNLKFKFFETKLNIDTADLAHGCECVCIFVNDIADAEVIDKLYDLGVRIIALRCAGYNNVDLKHAVGKMQVVRVPAYSPYAVAKLYAYWIMKNYRESYGMFAVNGILFNHESERRGENCVTRKITLAACRIAQGLQDKLYLGNLSSLRDWGYAKDYVECMWLMLQQEKPEDFVIATGEQHTVREFCTLAFKYAGIELEWQGEGLAEKGIDKNTGKVLVEVDPKYFRPAEVQTLLGDPTKARTVLGWNPRKTSFDELVRLMVESDKQFVRKV